MTPRMMKRCFFFLVGILLICSLSASGNEILPGNREGTTYYIDSRGGDDSNRGRSASAPFKTLERIRSLKLGPGDRVLLASGEEFPGSLNLKNVSGSPGNPVRVSLYLKERLNEKPVINAAGYPNAVLIENCSHVEISDLTLTANGGVQTPSDIAPRGMRCGLLVTVTGDTVYEGIHLENLVVRDVFYEAEGFTRPEGEVRTANGTQKYGWGIRIMNRNRKAVLRDVQIKGCRIGNVAHTGIKLTSWNSPGEEIYGIVDFKIEGNQVISTGGPGIQMSGVYRGHVLGNTVDGSGSSDDGRKWGRGSGLWTWGSSNVLIEKNRFLNAKGPGDSAGAHIDFNCRNVVLQYNVSANNAGGFCEILGNNHNCAYRYNISVNDGYRIKGEDGAFQEGKIFWLSGYVGNKKPRSGPFNSYFYNNTIYTSADMVAKFAVSATASGILITNNIFCIEGESRAVRGDQYRPDRGEGAGSRHVVFRNNLYCRSNTWPAALPVQDRQPFTGDPGISRPGGLTAADYLPSNKALVKDRGMVIEPIPGDSIGLVYGLNVDRDILGRELEGLPDLGAIEIPGIKN